jgi:hypothetical protein
MGYILLLGVFAAQGSSGQGLPCGMIACAPMTALDALKSIIYSPSKRVDNGDPNTRLKRVSVDQLQR